MKKVLILIALSFLFVSSFAKETTISGVESSYAGKLMRLHCYTDGIVGLEHTLDTCRVDSAGNFSFSVNINAPLQAFIPGQTVNGFIFLEPGSNYQVSIPAYSERTLAQKLDPYFKPMDVLIEIKGLNKEDFNYKLMEFEDAFDFYSMKHLVYGTNVDSILSSIQQLHEIFSDFSENHFLSNYMEYRSLLLLNTSPQVYQDSIISRLNAMGVESYNPAFWDLFNNLFDNFIPQLAFDREQYLAFQRVIEEGNVKMYFSLISKRYGITDYELKELVAIKWLYDLLNQNQFDHFKVLDLLQNIGSGISIDMNRQLLGYILNSTNTNYIGSSVPDFSMKTIDGNVLQFSDFIGKYIYLNFENSAIDQTQKDLDVMLRFQNDYKNDLVILNVGLYDTTDALRKLSQRYGGKMNFYLAANPDYVKELFAIKSIPSFFLIDKDGNFLMTKGAEPTDELRMLLQKIFKSN